MQRYPQCNRCSLGAIFAAIVIGSSANLCKSGAGIKTAGRCIVFTHFQKKIRRASRRSIGQCSVKQTRTNPKSPLPGINRDQQQFNIRPDAAAQAEPRGRGAGQRQPRP